MIPNKNIFDLQIIISIKKISVFLNLFISRVDDYSNIL